ncbi:hypothetical protein C0995_000118 [Termitomyces sp. Mi166|nr:hypothetical protein C0995_000118 [Termitomyces sp. Mi166\
MASKPAQLLLAERSDIHKSCKSLETLLSVLNDYCEAAGTTVILQKKLAKTLRETAGMKTTKEIAANALNASATIFEVSSDIDSKFAKIADKEYDALSSEVKKWFKKLAKEEKTHDERMTNANAKIKQAGESLLNHLLNVTQRHAATISSAAVCLSKIADAEWLKTCEGVRRHSSMIGQLGEWRAFCEGGWQGPVPPYLVDPVESQPLPREIVGEKPEVEEFQIQTTNAINKVQGKESRESAEHWHTDPSDGRLGSEPLRDHFTTNQSPTTNTNLQKSTIILDRAFPATQEQTSSQRANLTVPSDYDAHYTKETNMDSVRSLSAFPLPPTHFPIPPRRERGSQSRSSRSSTSYPRMTESPLPDDVDGTAEQPAAPAAEQPVAAQIMSASRQQPKEKPILPKVVAPSSIPETNTLVQPVPAKAQASTPRVLNSDKHYDEPLNVDEQSTQRGAEDTFDREFGMNIGYARLEAANTVYSPTLHRTDSGASNGSIVAAMRNRYQDNAAASGVISPNPRAAHRLSANINDLASHYQPSKTSSSPGPRTPLSRQFILSPNDSSRTRGSDHLRENPLSAAGYNDPTTSTSPRQEEAARRRQQRLNDLAQLERQEKELALRERELEWQQKTRELERERARLNNVREVEENGPAHDATRTPITSSAYSSLRPRERKPSPRTQRPQSQLDPGNSGSSQNLARPQSQYNLGPPSPSSNSVQHSHEGQSRTQSPYTSQYSHSPSSTKFPSSPADHAPCCGCESCSVAKYRAPQSPPDPASLGSPAGPIILRPPEKKSNWMRRLSMPVGNAFNFDSKKNASNQNLANVNSGQGRSRIFSLDGKKNMSSTQLNIREDGRRNYDASGISSRSMTNLGTGRG